MVWAIILIFVLEYIRPAMLFPPLEIIPLNAMVPIAAYLCSLFGSRNPAYRFLGAAASKFFLAFLLLVGLGVFTAPVTLKAYTKFEAIIGYLIVYYLLSKELKDERSLTTFLGAFLGIHVLLIFLNFELFLKGDRSATITSGSFLGDGNDFSLTLNIALPVGLFFVFHAQTKLRRVLAMVCCGLLVLGIIGVVSRGGILGMAAILFYYVIRSRRFALGITLIVAVVLLTSVFASSLFYERMGTLKDYAQEDSAMGRVYAWKAAVNMAKDKPLTGVGPGHFGISYFDYRVDENIKMISPHSFYFQLLGEMGFPGILVYLGLLYTAFRANSKYAQKARDAPEIGRLGHLFLFLNLSWVAYLVAGAFLSTAYYPHVFVLAGLTVAAGRCFDSRVESARTNETPDPDPGARLNRDRRLDQGSTGIGTSPW
jgi:probable O-glycosylation ligase (exosortase A-associated)